MARPDFRRRAKAQASALPPLATTDEGLDLALAACPGCTNVTRFAESYEKHEHEEQGHYSNPIFVMTTLVPGSAEPPVVVAAATVMPVAN